MTDEIWREIDLERKKKKKKCYREGNKLWFALKFSRCQPIDNLQSTSLAIFESATWNCTTFGEILRPSFDKILGRANLVATIVTSTQSDPVKLIRIHDISIAVWFDFSCPLTTSWSEMNRHYIRWYSSVCFPFDRCCEMIQDYFWIFGSSGVNCHDEIARVIFVEFLFYFAI